MQKPGFETVRDIGLAFPGVEESTCYGQPALTVAGKMFTCIPSHPSAEPGSLAVRIDFADRQALLTEAPDIYYVTGHYADYPCVLVRLDRIQPDALRGLLMGAAQFVRTVKGKRRARQSR